MPSATFPCVSIDEGEVILQAWVDAICRIHPSGRTGDQRTAGLVQIQLQRGINGIFWPVCGWVSRRWIFRGCTVCGRRWDGRIVGRDEIAPNF